MQRQYKYNWYNDGGAKELRLWFIEQGVNGRTSTGDDSWCTAYKWETTLPYN